MIYFVVYSLHSLSIQCVIYLYDVFTTFLLCVSSIYCTLVFAVYILLVIP